MNERVRNQINNFGEPLPEESHADARETAKSVNHFLLQIFRQKSSLRVSPQLDATHIWGDVVAERFENKNFIGSPNGGPEIKKKSVEMTGGVTYFLRLNY